MIARDRLERYAASGVTVTITLTRSQPPGWTGLTGRVTPDILREVVWPPSERAQIMVCGPTAFVEATADALVDVGHPPQYVKTERFGGTEGVRT